MDRAPIATIPFPVPNLAATTAANPSAGQSSDLLAEVPVVPGARAQPDDLLKQASDEPFARQLVAARLGLGASLYEALRARHRPTAAHSLRVALVTSAWVQQLRLSPAQREELELAALLHDIGKLSIPDQVLLKPGPLDPNERRVVAGAAAAAREILAGCCAHTPIPEVVASVPAWFDGRRGEFSRRGEQLPLGSRLIAIVDAYDAMTTDKPYRPAMSRERALAELYAHAGTQFDPHLVRDFCLLSDQHRLEAALDGAARRWLDQLPSDTVAWWRWSEQLGRRGTLDQDALFLQQLLDNTDDGVVFVDRGGNVLLWNRAAEQMSGVGPTMVLGARWSPRLLGMKTPQGRKVTEDECPVAAALNKGLTIVERFTVASREPERRTVDVQVVPVPASGLAGASATGGASSTGDWLGAVVLLHDASHQVTLENQYHSLQAKAARDPLTQVANRAEFDRQLELFVANYARTGHLCSLIICDIDHFKRINDHHGHPAGDAALVSFASLLRDKCREGDLVARYGGEEFVMLCADCDTMTAQYKAESIRADLARTPQDALGGACITASFGVTEVQEGDTPDSFLNRADQALLQAKDQGRNMVVQIGRAAVNEKPKPQGWWQAWFATSTPEEVLQRDLLTQVPIEVVKAKLEGFVDDQDATIVSSESQRVVMKIEGKALPLMRRRSDRPVPFFIELQLEERRFPSEGRSGGPAKKTVVRVTVRPQRQRDRRRDDVLQRAQALLVNLKSFLLATEIRREF